MASKNTEHVHQRSLFTWAEWECNRLPELKLMFAVPNGGYVMDPRVVAKLKSEGLKPGVPDIVLPVPRGRFHGLFIEMKRGHNKPSDKQEWWLKALEQQGYRCLVCYSWGEAQRMILDYLKLT